MRTKEEITKNKSFPSDKESLGSGPTPEQIIKKKRFYIIGAIFLTIGLSLIFIIYRQVREIIKKPIVLSLPSINLSKIKDNSPTFDLTPQINSVIKDVSKWNIVVATDMAVYNLPSNKIHFNEIQVNTLVSTLAKKAVSTEFSLLFPEGLIIHQQKSVTDQLQKLSLLVNPPNKNLIFDFEFQGDPVEFSQHIAKLVPSLYWEAIKYNN
ncbi:MAG: hypothetical protein WAV41_01345 [Microgenomates group bacterium]